MITDRRSFASARGGVAPWSRAAWAARHVFAEICEEIGGERGDPLHVCVLAHSMADVQDDVHQELVWDQRALAAADLLTDDRAAGSVSIKIVGSHLGSPSPPMWHLGSPSAPMVDFGCGTGSIQLRVTSALQCASAGLR